MDDVTQSVVDEHAAEAAYNACAQDWKAHKDDTLESPRVNLAYVLARVLQVGAAMKAPAVTEAFEALARVPMPAGPFDPGCVATLTQTAQALWYVRTRLLVAETAQREALLPAALVAEATARRNRMLRAAQYHCVDEDKPDDEMARELEAIQKVQGSRYLDLATDLSRLATIFRDPVWGPLLAADTRRVQSTDADAADANAAEILSMLGHRDAQHAHWQTELRRGWATLRAAYDQVQRGATVIFWPRGEATVPALGALRPPATGARPAAPQPPMPA